MELIAGDCLRKGAIDVKVYNATNSDFCPSVWDGIACWSKAAAGTLLTQNCPEYIAGFDHKADASRECMENGQWFVPKDNNDSWTNYSMCFSNPLATVIVKIPDVANASHFLPWMPMMKRMKQVGYSFSLFSLVVAFLILASSKRLRCPRNTLHMHLFISFILRAFMALLKDALFVQGIGLSSDVVLKDGLYYFSQQENNWVCKCMMSIWQFCIMANYSWIFMEGLYLHNLIFMALFTDSSAITLYVVLGWGFPVLVVVPWVILRATIDDNYCWTLHENRALSLLIIIPTVLSNLINFVLFLNIIRVLFLKLRSSICEETRRYRKWGRSTLVLMPLFGVHYSLFLFLTIGQNPDIEIWGIFLDQLFASFQGFFVAVLYCFLNGEVRTEVEKKWRYWRCPHALPVSGGGRVRSSMLEHGTTRCVAMSGAMVGNGAVARRSCTSNCTMFESTGRRFEAPCCVHPPAAASTMLLRRASDHLAGIDKNETGGNGSGPASERLLHHTSAIDEEATL
ncbi:hypothetical protein B566_EDAN014543 [Ephemera danica]|nr:hypothetical protein B566_EDAN014543 [Ephemera danica]